MVLCLTVQPLLCLRDVSMVSVSNNPSVKFAAIYRNAQKFHCYYSSPTDNHHRKVKRIPVDPSTPMSSGSRCCLCGKRHFLDASGTAFLPIISSSRRSEMHTDEPLDVLRKIHSPKPDWYEELYALILIEFLKYYEAEIAGLKSQLFSNLVGKAERILEVGIGTGPNLKYYATENVLEVYGIDPNRKMEKYARATAEAVGLSPAKFKFIPAVAEALPVDDNSFDVVTGTLVLCSVGDVDLALQEVKRVLRPGGIFLFIEHVAAEDGTFSRFVQNILNPLQKAVLDGCHLTRQTGKNILEAGFSNVEMNTSSFSTALILNPQVYGVAYK